ncbi:MAG TPA: type II toxin-antitoxin system VapC family toxin [Bryobacteraceae bacterium]
MRALLDTHIFVSLARQGADILSSRARKIVEDDDNDLLISAISIAEIAIKSTINKLEINASDTVKAAEDLRLIMIPFEPRYAIRMFDLPLHHRDPFDRMLIATALSEDIPIVSGDTEFKRYRGLRVIS